MLRGSNRRVALAAAIALCGVTSFLLLDASTNPAAAWLCMFASQTPAGMNTICYYNCVNGNGVAITVGPAQICPMSVED